MDQDLSHQDELNARRDAMRERLRQKADRVLEAVEHIEAPKTFVEVERAARAIIATDKMIIQIFSAPKAVSYDMRFGAAVYDDEREHIGSRSLYDDKAVDAPIVASGDTSPVSQGKMTEFQASSVTDCAMTSTPSIFAFEGEDERRETENIEVKTPKPMSGRLTKRQKRRLRAFTSQAPVTPSGNGLGP